jgi:hypothetical protein
MSEKYTFSTKLHEACANDPLRPIFACVHFMNGFACASEGHIAIRQSLEYHSIINPEMLDGKSLHKDNYKAIMGFEFAEANEDGIQCKDTDGRTAFYEYFKLEGDQPNFDKIFSDATSKGVKSVHFIGFNPVLLAKLAKALYCPDENIRCRFTGIDTTVLVDAVGVENQEAIIMPAILQDTLFNQ